MMVMRDAKNYDYDGNGSTCSTISNLVLVGFGHITLVSGSDKATHSCKQDNPIDSDSDHKGFKVEG